MAQKKKKRITRAQILKRSLIVLAIIPLLFSGNIISLINVQLVKNDKVNDVNWIGEEQIGFF